MTEKKDNPKDLKKDIIAQSLNALENAAKDNLAEIRDAATGKYESLRKALIGDMTIREAVKDARGKAMCAMEGARDNSEEKAKEVAGAIDKNVRSHPWPYLGGVALGALVLGFILGKHKD